MLMGFFIVFSVVAWQNNKPLVTLGRPDFRGFNATIERTGHITFADEDMYNRGFEWMADFRIYPEDYAHVGVMFAHGGSTPRLRPDGWNLIIDGLTVHQIRTDYDYTLVRVGFHFPPQVPDNLIFRDGQAIDATFTWNSPIFSMVPASAVHQDPFTGDFFVYFVDRVDGMWGREYRAIRESVFPTHMFEFNDFRNIHIFTELPIVFSSSEPLQYSGQAVRIFE